MSLRVKPVDWRLVTAWGAVAGSLVLAVVAATLAGAAGTATSVALAVPGMARATVCSRTVTHSEVPPDPSTRPDTGASCSHPATAHGARRQVGG